MSLATHIARHEFAASRAIDPLDRLPIIERCLDGLANFAPTDAVCAQTVRWSELRAATIDELGTAHTSFEEEDEPSTWDYYDSSHDDWVEDQNAIRSIESDAAQRSIMACMGGRL